MINITTDVRRIAIVGAVIIVACVAAGAGPAYAQDSTDTELGDAASSDGQADTGVPGYEPPCDCPDHVHQESVRIVPQLFQIWVLEWSHERDQFADRLAGAFIPAAPEDTRVRPGGWGPHKKDKANKAAYSVEGYYDAFKPFQWANVVNGGQNRDAGDDGLLGMWLVRVDAGYGDIHSKGWIGTDEDELPVVDVSISLPEDATTFVHANEWNSDSGHHGYSEITQELYVRGTVRDIGGLTTGRLSPVVQTTLKTHGISDEAITTLTAGFTLDHEDAVGWNVGAEAGAGVEFGREEGEENGDDGKSKRSRGRKLSGGGRLGMKGGLTGQFDSGVESTSAWTAPTVVKKGAAPGHAASNRIQNSIRIDVTVDDAFAAWEAFTRTGMGSNKPAGGGDPAEILLIGESE